MESIAISNGARARISKVMAVLGFAALGGSLLATFGFDVKESTAYDPATIVGNGTALSDWFPSGVTPEERAIWLGAYDGVQTVANLPTLYTINDEVWCIESSQAIANVAPVNYVWTTESNPQAAYALWLAYHQWDNNDGRAAVQYLLYHSAFPSVGDNTTGTDVSSLIYNHPDFSAASQTLATSFEALPPASLQNTIPTIVMNTDVGGTFGAAEDIGVYDAWGNLVPGITYTLTFHGDSTFDSSGLATMTGVTGATLLDQPYTVGTLDPLDYITISYEKASSGGQVLMGENGTWQDLAVPMFADLLSTSSVDPAALQFQPGGVSQVQNAVTANGAPMVDNFTTSTVSGSWTIDPITSTYIPVKYKVTLYRDTSFVLPVQTATPGALTEIISTQEITAMGPNLNYQVTFPNLDNEVGYFVFRWEVVKADQTPAVQAYIVDNWADDYGIPEETVKAVFTPSVSTSVQGGPYLLPTNAIIDIVTPGAWGYVNAAPVATDMIGTIYEIPASFDQSTLPVTGVPAEAIFITSEPHTFTGAPVAFDFGTPDDLGLEVGKTYTIVWSFALPASNNQYWTGSWSDDFGQVAETFIVTDVIPPVTFTTSAQSSAPIVAGGAPVDIWDITTLDDGMTFSGQKISYDIYELTDLDTPICDAGNLLTSTGVLDTVVGTNVHTVDAYEGYALPVDTTVVGIAWIATIYEADGTTVIDQGICGDPDETLLVSKSAGTGGTTPPTGPLASTGAPETGGMLFLTLLGLTLGSALLTGSRIVRVV